VEQAIRQTGYSPNQAARALVQKRSGRIGVIVHNLHDPFFYDLIRGFEEGAAATSYNVMFCSVLGGDMGSKEKYLRYLSGGVVDAVIMYGSYTADESMVRYMSTTTSIDYLLIENDIANLNCNKLLIDNVRGANAAMEYLVGKGHTRISHICGNPNKKVTTDRLSGYLQAMHASGLDVRDGYLQHTSADYHTGYERMQTLMRLPDRPTAVFCSDDAIASYAIRAAMDMGLRVPQDVSVMGFDCQTNLPEHYRGPAITSMKQPLYNIGLDSIRLLTGQLTGGKPYPVEHKVYETTIVEQETVCPPAGKGE
jgi:DNA-binding LacI/PurR family transcriptional regulator